jgi:cytochrome b subunit of formate dehydrogenase
MLSFLTQAATGLSRMFIETRWGQALAWVFGGYESCLTIHKYGGIFMMCGFLIHGLYLLSKIDWRQFPRRLVGPDSLLPRLEDIGQALQHMGWIVGIDKLLRLDRWGYVEKLENWLLKMAKRPPFNRVPYLKEANGFLSDLTKPPRFDRWGYWEKMDYWGVIWGIPLLGITGLIMAYPLISTRILPGWGLNVAFWIHRMEAILAICHVFIIHFFIGHLRVHNFPMDRAMFEGSVDLEEVRHERPAWIERLEKTGKLEGQLVAEASPRRRALFYTFGYFALAFGLFLLIGGLVNSTSITW